MKLNTFTDYVERLEDGENASRVILELTGQLEPDSDDFRTAIALLARDRFDNNGVGKATVKNIAVECFDATEDRLETLASDHGGLPPAIEQASLETERIQPRREKSLATLWTELREIEQGKGTKRRIRRMFSDWEEPKWTAHALLGNDGVSFGIGSKSIVNILEDRHGPFDTRRARALTPNIVELAEDIVNPERDVQTEPIPGDPFFPMLAKKKDTPSDPDKQWLLNPKYDGARILVHIVNGELDSAYSRNGKEVTESIPELSTVVEAIPDAGDYILDGEAIPFEDGEQVPFQKVMTRFGREEDIDEQDIDIEFKFFDLVYADTDNPEDKAYDGDLSEETYSTRSYLLAWLFPETPELRTPVAAPETRDELTEMYTTFLDEGYEGAVLKHRDSLYEFDKRSSDWRKMVPNKENVDLEITDVIEGEDGQAGAVGALRLETSDGIDVGKVGTGFTAQSADELWERRDELPGQIVEVSWRELQEKEDGTHSLRFPAFESLRPDKDTADSFEWVEAQ